MSTDKDLDKLYSPSQHSHRMSAEEVIAEFIKATTDESVRIRKGSIPKRLAVPYGDTDRETVDIYGTDLPNDAPIFVYVPGGYWSMISSDVSAYPVDPMNNADIVTIVVDYARAPGVTLTEIVNQVVKAIKWIHQFATQEREARSITLCGHSSGAHLCGMVLTSSWFKGLTKEEASIFKGVFHISGIFELLPLLRTYVNEPLGMTPEEAISNSPLDERNLNILSDILIEKCPNFKIFVLVAEHESPAFKLQGEKYSKEMSSRGLNSSFQTIHTVDHFNIVEKLSMKGYVVTAMIRSFIKQ